MTCWPNISPQVCLACAVSFCLYGCQADLVHHLSNKEATLVLAELREHDVYADKEPESGGEKDRYTISVLKGELGKASQILSSAPYLIRGEEETQRGDSQNHLVPTEAEERSRTTRALEAKLSNSIETLPGVLRATVHLSPREDGAKSTASVLVHTRLPRESSLDISRIKRLVAGAIGATDPNVVSVIAANHSPHDLQTKQSTTRWLQPISMKTIAAISMVINVMLAALVLAKPIKKLGRRLYRH